MNLRKPFSPSPAMIGSGFAGVDERLHDAVGAAGTQTPSTFGSDGSWADVTRWAVAESHMPL